MKMTRFVAPLVFGLACSLAAVAATPVNINTADAPTLAKSLDGVGMSKAKAIVAWRKAHGPFKNASQLAQVKGIGQRTIEHNKDAIRVSGK
mgnify:CR=1 FL=1